MDKITDLLDRYLKGTSSSEENQRVEDWLASRSRESDEWLQMNNKEKELWLGSLFKDIKGVINDKEKVKIMHLKRNFNIRSFNIKSLIAAAAVIIVLLSVGLYFFSTKYIVNNIRTQSLANSKQDVAPGGNKAFLILSDGSKISLTDAANGRLAEQAGINITKAKDGQLVYTVKDPGLRGNLFASNSIETPKGGQYQINLNDGTKVWLNAASSLKYPTRFSGKERKVELTGEAYFEVAHNKKMPFIVKTAKQQVEVLGTHFNINSYADEPVTKTTLLEGAVRVIYTSRHPELNPGFSSGLGSRTGKDNSYGLNSRTGILKQVQDDVVLKPGEQAINNGNNIKVKEADLEAVMAWKNGDFVFKNEALGSIMRKISRWYNVEVIYNADAPENITLGGLVSRYSNVSDVLKVMELPGKVHFKIEGRRIIVMK